LRREIRGEDDEEVPESNSSFFFEIPSEIDRKFTSQAELTYQDLSRVPLSACLDSSVFHLNEAVKKPTKQVPGDIRYLNAVIKVMKAAWFLKMMKKSVEYRESKERAVTNSLNRQLAAWGLTIERFVSKFENVRVLLRI
jgi:hypothetical protein